MDFKGQCHTIFYPGFFTILTHLGPCSYAEFFVEHGFDFAEIIEYA